MTAILKLTQAETSKIRRSSREKAIMQAPVPTTVETVVQFDQEYTRAQALVEEALARRNEAVLSVLENRVARQSVLAVRLGITPGRVSQIAAAAKRRRIAAAIDAGDTGRLEEALAATSG